MSDDVNPTHYRTGEVECIDAIRAALGPEGFEAFCRGNVIKYLWRHGKKPGAETDLLKARWYLSAVIGLEPRHNPEKP